jgi:hypothetical protein
MSFTGTASQTNSFTDARLKAVMPEVATDFYAMAAADLITYDQAASWNSDLTFLLQHQAVTGFQVQLRRTGADPIALEYKVSADGSILQSQTGGGINYFALPAGTKGSLCVTLNYGAPKIDAVNNYLNQRSWGRNGQALQGDSERDRAYSNNGYGFYRNRIGKWPS